MWTDVYVDKVLLGKESMLENLGAARFRRIPSTVGEAATGRLTALLGGHRRTPGSGRFLEESPSYRLKRFQAWNALADF
jgi:hypothetical protein